MSTFKKKNLKTNIDSENKHSKKSYLHTVSSITYQFTNEKYM